MVHSPVFSGLLFSLLFFSMASQILVAYTIAFLLLDMLSERSCICIFLAFGYKRNYTMKHVSENIKMICEKY